MLKRSLKIACTMILGLISLYAIAPARADGCYIARYNSGERLAEIDGKYVRRYGSGARIADIDGKYVKRYGSGERIAEIDGKYIKRYGSGERILSGVGCTPIELAFAAGAML